MWNGIGGRIEKDAREYGDRSQKSRSFWEIEKNKVKSERAKGNEQED